MLKMDLVNGTPIVVNETSTSCPSAQEDAGIWFMQMIMIIEIIVGLPGNIIALWIFFFRMKFWKPHIIFLLNLVLADFLLLISVPFRIHTHMRGENWVFGEVWCSMNLFMLAVNRSASIAFMTVVALDRYFKVIHPHHWISQMTLTHAAWLAALTWVAVIALRIPLLTANLLQQNGNISVCRSFNFYKVIPVGVKIHYVVFVAEFFLPWFLLLFSSAKIACYLNSASDPFIYFYSSSMFRNILRRSNCFKKHASPVHKC